MKFRDPIEQEIYELLQAAGLPEWEAEEEVLALREPLSLEAATDSGSDK